MAKKIKYTRKDLLKQPDQFLSSTDKVISIFTKNEKRKICSQIKNTEKRIN